MNNLAGIIVWLYLAASQGLNLYLVYIGYAGGRIPLTPWEIRGGFFLGSLWLLFGTSLFFVASVTLPALVYLGACRLFGIKTGQSPANPA